MMDEVDKRNYHIKDLVKALSERLLSQWQRANALFQPPVIINEKSLINRIKEDWEIAKAISNKQITKKSIISTFERKLDQLYDITKCQCEILLCPDVDCTGCYQGAHITCVCSRDQKIPTL